MRRLDPGPPTQNSVRSPKPWWAVSWDTICAWAEQSLIRAESSSRAKTSWRWTAPSPPASRLTTSRHSEFSGIPKNACLRLSPRRQIYVRASQPREALIPAAMTPSTMLRTSSFMSGHSSGPFERVADAVPEEAAGAAVPGPVHGRPGPSPPRRQAPEEWGEPVGDHPVVVSRGVPVTSEEVQARLVEVTVVDNAVARVVACLDHLPHMLGVPVEADGHEQGPGAVAGPEFPEELAVGGAVGGRQAVGRPRFTGGEVGEVVGAEVDHHDLGAPRPRVLPDVAVHVQQGAVVVGPVRDVRADAGDVAHHAEAGEAVDLVVGVQLPGGEGAVAHIAVGGPPELLRIAGAGARDVAVAHREGVPDELDLTVPGRGPAEYGAPGCGDEASERAGVPRGVVASDDPDRVLAVPQAVDPVRGVAGGDQGRDGGPVDLDVVVGGRAVEDHPEPGPAEAALEVHPGPAELHRPAMVLDPSRGMRLLRDAQCGDPSPRLRVPSCGRHRRVISPSWCRVGRSRLNVRHSTLECQPDWRWETDQPLLS